MSIVTTIVLSHGNEPEPNQFRRGGLNTTIRHIPIWLENTDNLVIVSPNDNPCVIKGINCVTFETRQHHGQFALRRQLFAMELGLMMYKNTDQFVFLEYDALMLKRPQNRPIIQGNLFNERIFLNRQEDWMAKGACFLHYPWIFPFDKLKLFLEKVTLDADCHTAHDIWIAQKLMKYNFEIHNLLGLVPSAPNGTGEGYSQNSLDTEERISNAVFQVKNGAYAIHGVKTEECLIEILKAKASI